jgi:dynein heavy chain
MLPLCYLLQTMKDNLVRAFSTMDPELLRQNNRSEWPALLHNVCYLHAAIKLRARFGRGGWNCPHDFLHIGNNQLQVTGEDDCGFKTVGR